MNPKRASFLLGGEKSGAFAGSTLLKIIIYMQTGKYLGGVANVSGGEPPPPPPTGLQEALPKNAKTC